MKVPFNSSETEAQAAGTNFHRSPEKSPMNGLPTTVFRQLVCVYAFHRISLDFSVGSVLYFDLAIVQTYRKEDAGGENVRPGGIALVAVMVLSRGPSSWCLHGWGRCMRFHGGFFHGVLKLFSSRYVVIVSWPSLGLRFHGASMVLWRAPIVRIVSILRGAILNRTIMAQTKTYMFRYSY